MKRIITLGFVLVLLLLALSLVHAEPVAFEYKFTKGEVDKYRLTIDMNISAAGVPADTAPMNSKISLVLLQKTLDVLEDGTAKIQVSYTDQSMSMPGMPKEQAAKLPSQTITMNMSKDGKVLSMDGVGNLVGTAAGPGMDFGQMLSQVGYSGIFPPKPINVGESWSQAVPIPFGGGSVNINSTLVSTGELISDVDASKVKQDYKGHIDLGQLMKAIASSVPNEMKGEMAQAISSLKGGVELDGSTLFYFSPTLGKLLKANGNIVSNIKLILPEEATNAGAPPQMDMVMNLNLNITRFK